MQLQNIITDMQPGNYYIDNNNIVHIVADYVSRKELNFTCPFCWSRYKKDGTPTKTAKKITHYQRAPSEACLRARLDHLLPIISQSGNFPIVIQNETPTHSRYMSQTTQLKHRIYTTCYVNLKKNHPM